MKVLGIRIDAVTKSEALARVSGFLSSGGQHTIFTPNPEMLVAAHRDHYFQDILNESSLNICDGRGVELAIKFLNIYPSLRRRGRGEVNRIPGIDFMLEICHLAAETGRKVYLLGSGDDEIIKNTAKAIQARFPKLRIVGYHSGPHISYLISHIKQIQYDSEVNDALIEHIIMTTPEILFVAFGHEKQEKWIYEHLPQLPSVKIAMGVGGAFDVLGGKLKRAPIWMRKAGLEWLWRLIQEPKRLKRIWTAVIVFPYLVIKNQGRLDVLMF